MKLTIKRISLKDIYRPDIKYLRFLAVLLFTGISYGLYRGIQDNYLAELVHITNFERGVVEFFREIPGLLVVVIFAVLYRLSENRIFKIGLCFMTLGLICLLFAGTGKFIVVLFMVLYSLGEHIVLPLRSTISMHLAKKETGGAALGVAGALDNVGRITGFILVSILFLIFARFGYKRNDLLPFKVIYGVSVVFMIATIIFVLPLEETQNKAPRRRFYFAKKFTKFYMLEVFYGARKQVFLTFAPYVLILQYGADASVIAMLMAISAAFGIIFNPLIGKLIDKVGYKFIMVTDTLILVVVCFFYGFAHRIFPPHIAFKVVYANYILDAIISLASMASSVYVRDIASSQEEVTATISTGISVNHVISIFIALMGGWIWKVTGIEVLFSLSAVLGILNSIYAATIKKPSLTEEP
ncbi:MFS transporter [Treponema primitia]|uniref:MFS transporter n=1 Tax=Treponema primitia TaxID=88058 RepID=UPI0002554E3D|nr:MFS transporter [Treponema primitia]